MIDEDIEDGVVTGAWTGSLTGVLGWTRSGWEGGCRPLQQTGAEWFLDLVE